jgi:hypothetical protein
MLCEQRRESLRIAEGVPARGAGKTDARRKMPAHLRAGNRRWISLNVECLTSRMNELFDILRFFFQLVVTPNWIDI